MKQVETLRLVESLSMKPTAPQFRVGDTVDVEVKILEGDGKDAKERIQLFGGTVIARKGFGVNASFTVRKIVNNEGVERTFMLHSPKIGNVIVRRSGKTRRAKLFFLRDRTGKATRLREVKAKAEVKTKAKPDAKAKAEVKADDKPTKS